MNRFRFTILALFSIIFAQKLEIIEAAVTFEVEQPFKLKDLDFNTISTKAVFYIEENSFKAHLVVYAHESLILDWKTHLPNYISKESAGQLKNPVNAKKLLQSVVCQILDELNFLKVYLLGAKISDKDGSVMLQRALYLSLNQTI